MSGGVSQCWILPFHQLFDNFLLLTEQNFHFLTTLLTVHRQSVFVLPRLQHRPTRTWVNALFIVMHGHRSILIFFSATHGRFDGFIQYVSHLARALVSTVVLSLSTSLRTCKLHYLCIAQVFDLTSSTCLAKELLCIGSRRTQDFASW